MWTIYTLSVFVDQKKPGNIIDALMTQWIGKFGVMKALMTDNGGEFNSDEMREITSLLNVQLCITAGESPFQIGLCERVHVFVDRMKPSYIIDALMTQWIGKFGVMKALMTDNSGEFNSDEMREITSILNVQLCTTAGESPFQNGLCERVHAITDMMLVKLAADYGKVKR